MRENKQQETSGFRGATKKPIKLLPAIKKIASTGGQYAITRLPVSINIFGNAYVLARLGGAQAASGHFITVITYAVMGSIRNIVLATGMSTSELIGKGEEAEVGNTVRVAWIIGVILSMPTLAIHLTTGKMLKTIGIDDDIANSTQDFFTAISFGLPAMFWVPTDIIFAVSTKEDKFLAPLAGISYAGITMAVGFPMALYGYGASGLGYGAAAAAWGTLLWLRIYFFFSSKHLKYKLFKCQLHGFIKPSLEILNRGLALGFQNITEWGNFLAISLMIGSLGKDASIAQAVALQPISAYNVMLLGFSQGVGVGVANYLGKSEKCLDTGDAINLKVYERNVTYFGNVGIAFGSIMSIIVGGLFIILSNQLINILSGGDDININLCKSFIIINSVGLVFDSMRNISTSILIGSKDPWVPPILSFIFMSLIAAPTGGVMSLAYRKSPNWIYITRDAGVALSSASIFYRWARKKELKVEKKPLISRINSDSERADRSNIRPYNLGAR